MFVPFPQRTAAFGSYRRPSRLYQKPAQIPVPPLGYMPVPLYRTRIIKPGDKTEIIAYLGALLEPAAVPHMGDISVGDYRANPGHALQPFHVPVRFRFRFNLFLQFIHPPLVQFQMREYCKKDYSMVK